MHKKRFLLILGIVLGILLIASYFITINVDKGTNFIVNSSLLGYLIFYNPFILGIYILVILILILKGLK